MCIHKYTYNSIIFSHEKVEILPFVTIWMDLEGIMLSEISQTEKDKYYMISYVESKKQTKSKHIDTENRLVVGSGQRGQRGLNGQTSS